MTLFSSFRTRLLVFVLVLLLPVLMAIYAYVSYQNTRYTSDTIDSYLRLGADVFDFSLEEHQRTLLTIASTLTRDWGFRNAFGAADSATVLDAARNLLTRTQGAADMLLVTDLEGAVIADTLGQGMTDLEAEWSRLTVRARRNEGQAQGIVTVGESPYLVTVVPLFLPTPVAWVFAGFQLDDEFVDTIQQTVVSDISILRYQRTQPETPPEVTLVASTLEEDDRDRLVTALDTARYARTQRIALSDSDHGTLVRSLYGEPGDALEFVATIQRSYRENEENLQALRNRLLQFYLAVIAVSVIGAFSVSRSVTRPVLALASRVQRIDRGDYRTVTEEEQLALKGRDEIAGLADSVNSMAAGLAEKEQVRDLLGKVVSRDVADELLSRRIELGGEEKVVSVLFVDIRGFTTLSEQYAPARLLGILNTYLSEMTRIIERNRGIVDKYTGDAVMAVFGAPLSREDDVRNAVATVPHVAQALQELHRRPDIPALEVGIGLHTGVAVAGNIGSASRMNYTVIGDSVNLASRLESLCRFYQVANIVSDTTRRRAPAGFVWSRLDRVRVKGRSDALDIHELLGREGEVPPERLREADRFEEAFVLYLDRDWESALEILRDLDADHPRPLYRIYRERIEQLIRENPSNWDGVFTFDHK
ncbi:MAG: adenylate/guanylate cyclase domain-containing protein [Pseudohongiellaceae bacterium]